MKQQITVRARVFFTLAALLVVLMSNVYVVFAEPEILPLLWKYEEDGLTYERICKPGKLVIMSNSKNSPNYGYDYNYLIDLTDGRIVYKSDPNKDLGVYTNYFGDRYYVVSIEGMIVKEYDVKTNKFMREVLGPLSAPDSSLFSYNSFNNSIIFKNGITGLVLDSFKIPNTPNYPYLSLRDGRSVTNDSKYFAFSLITNEKPYTKRFYLYDRVNREIIFEKSVDSYGYFMYSFFNKTNKMAFYERMQQPGDEVIYSYIRIYDPDNRTIIKDIKLGTFNLNYFTIHDDDNKIIYQLADSKNPNIKRIFDLEKNKKLDYSFTYKASSFLIADENAVYGSETNMAFAFKLDWNLVGIEEKSIDNDSIIFPNPTNNLISLTIPQIYYWGTWQINDLTGTVVLKGKLDNRYDLTIDIGNLSPQIYYLTLVNGNEKLTYKIIKQ